MTDYIDKMYKNLGTPVNEEAIWRAEQTMVSAAAPLDINFGLLQYGEEFERLEDARTLSETKDSGLYIPTVEEAAPHLLSNIAESPKDTELWTALFDLFPDWRWGRQPTGDCTCWGKEHGLDCTMAMLYASGQIGKPKSRVYGSALYGGAKGGRLGRKSGGQGSTSWAVSEAADKLGWLHWGTYKGPRGEVVTCDIRHLHSVEWGNRTQDVPKWLQDDALVTQAGQRIRATSAREAAALIVGGYAVDYSGYCPWVRRRGDDGIGVSFSRGAHMMCLTGVRFKDNGDPLCFWNANTGHGDHVTGPVGPMSVPDMYAACGGWISSRTIDGFMQSVSNHAHSSIEGWPVLKMKWDWV